VKIAPIIRTIKNTDGASYELVYAGREDDPTLEPSLFDDLQMPRPDVFLGVDSTSLNEITSRVMAQFDAYLDQAPADVVIVVDDLASTMAAAIVTKKRGLKLAHLVAGTRSFDMQMPKEVNRLVIDALSDYLFTAGVRSNSVATREQAEGANTYMVGNILMDTLRYNHQRLMKPQDLDLEPGSYLVFTLNRRALLADEQKLRQLLQSMTEAADGTPIIAPMRSNAMNKVISLHLQPSTFNLQPSTLNLQPSTFNLHPPFSYLEFGWLTAHAKGIITDSGNVAEEATFNGVPCITLNSYTEHQETISVGTNVLVGEDPEKLAEEVKRMVAGQWKTAALPDRWDGRTAERIVQILCKQ
jgi:UDP-N-acetylglucosamine 2-epimerase (non-hydrolysing)